jgi:hypothetical protein
MGLRLQVVLFRPNHRGLSQFLTQLPLLLDQSDIMVLRDTVLQLTTKMRAWEGASGGHAPDNARQIIVAAKDIPTLKDLYEESINLDEIAVRSWTNSGRVHVMAGLAGSLLQRSSNGHTCHPPLVSLSAPLLFPTCRDLKQCVHETCR